VGEKGRAVVGWRRGALFVVSWWDGISVALMVWMDLVGFLVWEGLSFFTTGAWTWDLSFHPQMECLLPFKMVMAFLRFASGFYNMVNFSSFSIDPADSRI